MLTRALDLVLYLVVPRPVETHLLVWGHLEKAHPAMALNLLEFLLMVAVLAADLLVVDLQALVEASLLALLQEAAHLVEAVYLKVVLLESAKIRLRTVFVLRLLVQVVPVADCLVVACTVVVPGRRQRVPTVAHSYLVSLVFLLSPRPAPHLLLPPQAAAAQLASRKTTKSLT